MDPRDPTAEEIELVKLLLPDGAFPDVEIYRQQTGHLRVTRECSCGCPTIDFMVDTARAPRANFHGDPLLPIEAESGDDEGHVQVVLFARHGWLESLELVYYSEQIPTTFPDRSDLRLVHRPRRTRT